MANFVNNVPTTIEAINSPDLELPEQFGVFMDAFNHPDSAYRPTTVIGEELEQYARELRLGLADRRRDRPAGRSRGRDAADPGRPRSGGVVRSEDDDRRHHGSGGDRAGGATSVPRSAAPDQEALPAGAAVPVAVDRRVPRLHALPDGLEPVLLVHELRPALDASRGSGSRTTGSCSRRIRCSGPRSRTRHGSSWSACRLRILAAIVTASLLVRPRSGVKGYRTHVLPADARPGGRGGARFPLPVQPGDRAGEPDPRRRSASRTRRSGSTTRNGRSRRWCC